MKTIGITGGIGSGKTTVANIFLALGIPVFFSDLEAARIVFNDDPVCKKIVKEFGREILGNGKIDRKKLAQIVFSDKEKLARLNSIVHPAVRSAFSTWAANHKSSPYLIQEAAILFETGIYKKLDYVILVSAPEGERIKRVMNRDQISKKEVIARMRNQWTDKKKKEMANTVIINDGRRMLLPQVLEIHRKLIGPVSKLR